MRGHGGRGGGGGGGKGHVKGSGLAEVRGKGCGGWEEVKAKEGDGWAGE